MRPALFENVYGQHNTFPKYVAENTTLGVGSATVSAIKNLRPWNVFSYLRHVVDVLSTTFGAQLPVLARHVV